MTLTEYCTGIADAIRAKEGSTEAIPAPDHAARILALSGGGSEYIEVTMTGVSGSSIRYIDENGEQQTISTAKTVTAKVYRGVVVVSTGDPIASTGDRVIIGKTYIFRSDGGTIVLDA